jgi:transcriptional regulator with XRE-family HTH domain
VRLVGENIKRERITWGMSQAELASRLGIARDMITKVEAGTRKPTVDELATMAQVFQVSVDELVRGPKQVVYDRVEPGRPEVEEARNWLDRCIENSLFVRRISRHAR